MYRAEIPVQEYEKLAAQFDPIRFDAREWVSLAKRAGQKYLIITSKHHDGFCLFDSAVTDYDSVSATPFKRDVLKELAEACAEEDIKLGFYYSQTQDWHHPDGDGNDWDFDPAQKDFAGYIEGYVKPQVRELLTNYGPVAIIWFDTPKGISEEQSRSLLALCNELQPDCLVCGRLGNALGDYATATDNRIPDTILDLDWETPATLNDSWSYKLNDHNWKSSVELIRKLVEIVSKGGNYLLNVGPTGEGVIPQASVDRLEAMGRWLAVNSEAIYGTQAGPVQGRADVRSTCKDGGRLPPRLRLAAGRADPGRRGDCSTCPAAGGGRGVAGPGERRRAGHQRPGRRAGRRGHGDRAFLRHLNSPGDAAAAKARNLESAAERQLGPGGAPAATIKSCSAELPVSGVTKAGPDEAGRENRPRRRQRLSAVHRRQPHAPQHQRGLHGARRSLRARPEGRQT